MYREFFLKLKKILPLLLAATVILLCYLAYNKGVSDSQIPIQPVSKITTKNVVEAQKKADTYISDKDAAQVTKEIHKVSEKPANIQYVTYTQAEADTKANTLAQKEKADYVIKETTSNTDNQPINNNFYSITQEKKNRIAVGIAYIDKDYYATVAYQKECLRIEAYKGLSNRHNKLDGVGVSYDVVKW